MMGDRLHRLQVSRGIACSRKQPLRVQPVLTLPKKLPKESATSPRGPFEQPTESSVAASVIQGFVGKPTESPLPVMPIASPPPFPLLA